MRRAAKRDTTEAAVAERLALRGAFVVKLSNRGIPDLLIGYRGRWVVAEVKSPGGLLRLSQQDFRDRARYHRLPWFLLRSAADADTMLNKIGETHATEARAAAR
jgi:hypothetical protein